GEINTRVSDMHTTLEKIDQLAVKYQDGRIYTLDRISAEYPDWNFNVPASNTEAMLRLIVGAITQELMKRKRDDVLAGIRARSRFSRACAPDGARGELTIYWRSCGLSIVVMPWLPKPVRRVRSP